MQSVQLLRHQDWILLFMPIFILVYLLPFHAAVAAPFSQPLRRQVIPTPSGGATPSTTWTYNYWWPFPPATPTPPTTTAVTTITTIFSLPSPSPSTSVNNEQSESAPDSSSFTSVAPTTSTSASSSISATSSTVSLPSPPSLSNNNGDDGASSNTKGNFNIHYLIPLFSVAGLVGLIGAGWLIHGCCTRKPKYRTHYTRSVSRNRASRAAGGTDAFTCDKELGVAPDASEVTFRAFRYEDLSVDPEHQCTFDDSVWDTGTSKEAVTRCQHTREYGFECDCRQSMIESEQIQFQWPRTRLEDTIDEEEAEEGDVQKPKRFSVRTRTDRTLTGNSGPGGVFSPLEILSDSCSEPDLMSECGLGGEEEKDRLRDGYFDAKEGTGTIGRQEKLLEGVRLEDRKRERLPRRSVTRKSRKTIKSTKSVKRSKTSRTSRSVCGADDNDGGREGEEEGFCMMAESPPPSLDDGDVQPLVVGTRRKAREVGDGATDGWMGKMADAIGSSFSRLSGSGKDEDKYPALPEPSNRARPSPGPRNKLKKKRGKDTAPHPPAKAPNRTIQMLQEDESRGSRRTTLTSTPGVTEEEIAAQKRRLQSHRDSIASLPAGMVFSPPSVGVCVFEEDGGSASSTEKLLPKVPQ